MPEYSQDDHVITFHVSENSLDATFVHLLCGACKTHTQLLPCTNTLVPLLRWSAVIVGNVRSEIRTVLHEGPSPRVTVELAPRYNLFEQSKMCLGLKDTARFPRLVRHVSNGFTPLLE